MSTRTVARIRMSLCSRSLYWINPRGLPVHHDMNLAIPLKQCCLSNLQYNNEKHSNFVLSLLTQQREEEICYKGAEKAGEGRGNSW